MKTLEDIAGALATGTPQIFQLKIRISDGHIHQYGVSSFDTSWKLKLGSFTPAEVAIYLSSKGFEVEL